MQRPRARIGLAGLGPKVVSLAGHHDVFLCRLKQRDTVKVTVGNRLKRHWIQHTIVDAGRRLFGAIYLHALHALGHVICLWRDAILNFSKVVKEMVCLQGT